MGGSNSRSRSIVVALVAACVFASIPAAPVEGRGAARHGVTRREVTIGIHSPLTGAAPLASNSVQRGAKVYWRWLRRKDRAINGRYVRTVLMNDNYNPSQAVAVCKEMVEEDHVFLLAGILQGSGVNQVQACARYAASVNVPYVSLGMTKLRLKRLPRYFAVTPTWPREGRLAADFLVSRRSAKRDENAIVWMNTPTFEDTHDAFVRTMEKRGAAITFDRSVPKTATQTHAQETVAEMKALGIDNVFIMTTPVWFLQVLQSAGSQGFRPLWTGPSTITTSGDAVAAVACRQDNFGNTRFLSPLPAFHDRDDFDLKHDRAMRKIYDANGDSITWLGWAGSKAIARLLDGADRDLTRRRFARRTERDRRFQTGIFPPFGFTPRDHFGGKRVHVLKMDCNRRAWVTARRSVRNF